MNRVFRRAPESIHANGRRIRTLVVDDFPLVIEAIVAFVKTHPRLELVGTARQGMEAVELAGTLHPDLVLMDRQMPVMDGLEATQRIKAKQDAPRIVILTDDGSENFENVARHAGADGLLSELQFYEQLLPLIRMLFPNRSG